MKFLFNLFLLSILLLCFNQTKILKKSAEQNPNDEKHNDLISYKGARATQSVSKHHYLTADKALKNSKTPAVIWPLKQIWWRVQFPKFYEIRKIKIRAGGDGLSEAKVFVGKQQVGSLPEVTKDGETYEIEVKKIIGNEVKIVSSLKKIFELEYVQVFGQQAKDPNEDKPKKPKEFKILSFKDAKAEQSSGYHGDQFPASNALKDNDSFCHTAENAGAGQWWKVTFPNEKVINKIRIQNRKQHGGDRLSGAKVFIGKTLVYTFPKTTEGQWYDFKFPKMTGKEIKIVSTQNQPIHFQRIQIFGHCLEKDPKDIFAAPEPDDFPKISLLGAKAEQSSGYHGNQFPASNVLKEDNSFNHTKENAGPGQWWKVTLPKFYLVKYIRIRNRVDCCGARLHWARVFFDGELRYAFPNTKEGQWREISHYRITREIKIVTKTNQPLHISGIEIYGEEADMDYVPNYLLKRYSALNTKK